MVDVIHMLTCAIFRRFGEIVYIFPVCLNGPFRYGGSTRGGCQRCCICSIWRIPDTSVIVIHWCLPSAVYSPVPSTIWTVAVLHGKLQKDVKLCGESTGWHYLLTLNVSWTLACAYICFCVVVVFAFFCCLVFFLF